MYYQKRGNKYGAKSSVYNGDYYHSKAEAGYAAELDLRVKAKDIKSWRRQVTISLDVNGVHICNYIADFEVTHNDDSKEIVEVKGMVMDLFRFKWRLLEALWAVEKPEVKLTIVKV